MKIKINKTYKSFLKKKNKIEKNYGFAPIYINNQLFDFQNYLVEWSLKKGRSAIFADCGLGKTPIQLVWAENIVRKTNGKVLILTPLAVSPQTVREGEKFGIKCKQSRNGKIYNITVTNYEKLHMFNKKDFIGIVCDESSILKNYSGKIRNAIIDFCKNIPYRLLCTATPAPNDYMELGNSCEALGVMRRVEMLSTFFIHNGNESNKWILKGHAGEVFWRFMTSWARAMKYPKDLGFENDEFILPELKTKQFIVPSSAKAKKGTLFIQEAIGLNKQRQERRDTLEKRCETVAEIANKNNRPFLAWCSLNKESEILSKLIKNAIELSGSDTEQQKEEKMMGFSNGDIRCLVTKPSIAGFGLNWHHCNQMSFFPSHSHEQYYQAVRRCWRFGQKKSVTVYIVTSEAESRVLENMKRKENQAKKMFKKIIKYMNQHKEYKDSYTAEKKVKMPSWI